jgi:hypothetical protein
VYYTLPNSPENYSGLAPGSIRTVSIHQPRIVHPQHLTCVNWCNYCETLYQFVLDVLLLFWAGYSSCTVHAELSLRLLGYWVRIPVYLCSLHFNFQISYTCVRCSLSKSSGRGAWWTPETPLLRIDIPKPWGETSQGALLGLLGVLFIWGTYFERIWAQEKIYFGRHFACLKYLAYFLL